ncbi:hypothetical protein [Zavarzinia compransoris]|uniref:Uncharacterized protein n=1 Tax=Zavarzinia compransoris TaxID=1264899 RepID=A0A317DVW5_9PROT|nr:hypothetical protein [Zavarzinia compransoris]PWR18016.1 hypothetical protein DKG75_20980 [Zavarzinia compransoris]TDP43519.1 hypothetical protein DES42_11187 [Zavarzinia compransoris]
MYRYLTWAVGILALAPVVGAIGYDLTIERLALAHAVTAREETVRPAGEVSNEGVERIVVMPLQPAEADRRTVQVNASGPVVAATRQEMGSAVHLQGAPEVFTESAAGSAWVELSPAVAAKLAGRMARITLWARADRQNPSREFAMALTIDGGPAEWTRFTTNTVAYESYAFNVPVPADAAGRTLRVMIMPDMDQKGAAIAASHLIIDRVLRPGEADPATIGQGR